MIELVLPGGEIIEIADDVPPAEMAAAIERFRQEMVSAEVPAMAALAAHRQRNCHSCASASCRSERFDVSRSMLYQTRRWNQNPQFLGACRPSTKARDEAVLYL